MSAALERRLGRLEAVLGSLGRVAVAASGGVDSMTLAFAARRFLGAGAEMVHAVSPAVPAEATARVRALALEWGMDLRLIDAGEFADPDSLANPVNRCFYCKSRLYEAIALKTDRAIVSGTNTDDLGDFRPGLEAARQRSVRHPFVEAAIGKADVRAIARLLDLGGLAELPASPCLSSRVETGLMVRPETLALVHDVETRVRRWLSRRVGTAQAVRCRVRRQGLAVELDSASLSAIGHPDAAALKRDVARLAARQGFPVPVPFEPYRRGSAFTGVQGSASGEEGREEIAS